MKKLFILALVCLVSTMVGQTDSTKSKTTGYLSVGLSLSNGNNFDASSYSAIEGGIMRENLGLGVIFGRGNFVGLGKGDNISNYYYEVKASASIPLGILNGQIIFGYGGYFNTTHSLIEYGAGISYSKGKFSYGVTYSNWDGVNYMTPSITFNF